MNIEWDLLVRYLSDMCDKVERERFEQWLMEAPEHQAILQGAKDMIAQAGREVSARRSAELLASLRRDISAAESSNVWVPRLRVVRNDPPQVIALPLPASRGRWSIGLRVAAAVFLVAGGAALWTLPQTATLRRAVPMPTFREVVSVRGQRVTLQLSDGSTVMLAPESRLRVPHDYGTRDRTVSLIGEGAFTVTHDTNRPFSVHTTRGIVKDLGTQFIVREYAEDSTTEVVVAEGEVELRGQRNNDGRVLSLRRGQFGRLEANGEMSARSEVDLEDYWAWTKGRLVFRDTPLHEATAELSRWYDVQIQLVPQALGSRHLTASVRDEPVEDVLRTIAASLGLNMEMSDGGRVFILRAR